MAMVLTLSGTRQTLHSMPLTWTERVKSSVSMTDKPQRRVSDAVPGAEPTEAEMGKEHSSYKGGESRHREAPRTWTQKVLCSEK